MGVLEATAAGVQHEVVFMVQICIKILLSNVILKTKNMTPPKLFIHNLLPQVHALWLILALSVSADHSVARHPWKRRCVILEEVSKGSEKLALVCCACVPVCLSVCLVLFQQAE